MTPVSRILTFIRFSHTVFALPFALGSMFVAADGWPGFRLFGLILLAMVFARTSAMVFNRLVDWEIDKRNPRTEGRHRLLPKWVATALLIVSSVAFVGVALLINPVCLALSPAALAGIFFYSLTKRFTAYSHFFLGFALGLSPVGAWLAVSGGLAWPPVVLAVAVLLWVAGFDLIYATQDVEFDRGEGLHSMAVRLGIDKSLALAQWLHAAMLAVLALFGWISGSGAIYAAGLALVGLALVFEHRVARSRDIGAINRAFFHSNAFVGAAFLGAIMAERLGS